MPASDAVATIVPPPPRSMARMASRMPNTTPSRFTPMIRRYSSSVRSSTSRRPVVIPALRWATSIRPRWSSAWRNASATSAELDAKAWRRWLGGHHANTPEVWLVLAKKGTREPTSLTYDDALEEALCFGWIDGKARRRDDRTYRQRFTPRRARSAWSRRNVEIA